MAGFEATVRPWNRNSRDGGWGSWEGGGGGRVEAGRRGEGCWGEVGVEARSSTI